MLPTRELSPEEIQKILESYKWTFAKTYATKAPHWWSHIKTSGDSKLFIDVSRWIWHNGGDTYQFYRTTYPIFRAGGYRYWLADSKATDEQIDGFLLINRTLDDDDELERMVEELGYKWNRPVNGYK